MKLKVIFIFLIYISLLLGCSPAKQDNRIVEIAIVATRWDIASQTSWSSASVLNDDISTVRITTKNSAFLKRSDNYLKTMTPVLNKPNEIDARIVCLVKRENDSVDTLSFGLHKELTNKSLVVLNGKVYMADKSFFENVTMLLPYAYKRLIDSEHSFGYIN